MRELDDARYKAIGARIRDVRLQRNMSQAELAEKAFISVPHMSEVENGKTKLRLSTFVYITEALQVSADVLLRTNTPEVIGIYQGEFNDLLADCSPAEIDSIPEHKSMNGIAIRHPSCFSASPHIYIDCSLIVCS